uniref:Uncharacterized protein n=1 Tax=Oryza nivara TaxID=4536 RepID=A0A0E0HXM8_ORYNI
MASRGGDGIVGGGRGPLGGRDGRGRGPAGGRGGGRGGGHPQQQQQQQPGYGRGDGGGRGPAPAAGGVVGRGTGGGGGGGRGDGGRGRGRGGGGGDGVRPAMAAAPAASTPGPVAVAARSTPPPTPAVQIPAVASSSSAQPAAAAQPPPAAAAVSALARDVGRQLAVVAGGGRPAPPAAPPAPIPVSSKGVAPPSRPGFGTVGERIVVRANHFLVRVSDNDMIYLYDVSLSPPPKTRRINRVVMSELARLHRESHLGGISFAYDGSKALYTAGKLPFDSMDFKIKLGKELREIEYKVTIRRAGQADLHHLHEFIAGRQRDSQQQTIQALDVVLRESPSLNYVIVSRSFYSTMFGRQDIGDGLECWKGYYQSLRPTQMGLSLNIDISSTPFFKPISVVEYVKNCLGTPTNANGPDPRRPLSDIDRLKVKKALRGVRVETTHQGKSSKYKITTITSEPLSQLNFSMDGTTQTVIQYFSQRYKYRLQYTSWPCLQSGNPSNPIYLPMEVCTIVEGQRYSKKLNDKQVTGLLRATCQPPQKRGQKIIEMVQHNNYPADKVVSDFRINISNQMATMPARVLPAPTLRYHDSGKEKTCNPRVGQWNMINKKMVGGAVVQKWTCVNFSRMHIDAVHRLCGELVYTCNAIGMVFNEMPEIEVGSAAPNNIEAALSNIHTRAPQLQLLIVILPDVNGYYGRIKRVCETELGIVSQCLKPGRKLLSLDRQFLENVSLKINVKAGGRNSVLQRPLVPGGLENTTIIFGADVTHPASGEDSSASIAAVVASMDWPEITKYKALVSAQPPRQEIIQDLFTMTEVAQNADAPAQKAEGSKKNFICGGMFRELLMSFYSKNAKRKPQRIIFYRDGVSDGQFLHVLLYEMDAIKKAIASLDPAYRPLVTFVVVQKRHHTRLFPEVHGRQDLTDRSGNVRPGTVVDTNICHPSEFDFYLCSHAGIQGTSRPTHYHILHDENRFSADQLQMLTYNLCYTYARCTRSVSVAYYAHLAAFRARYYDEPPAMDGASSVGSGGQPPAVRRLPQIKENVKDVMFYC